MDLAFLNSGAELQVRMARREAVRDEVTHQDEGHDKQENDGAQAEARGGEHLGGGQGEALPDGWLGWRGKKGDREVVPGGRGAWCDDDGWER